MSLENLILDNIKALNKSEFDEVARFYLSEVYNFKRIVNTDGKDDHGNDIRIFDTSGIKNQYQLTVQKSSFESKLIDDLEKAKRNHKEFGYSNTLFFFYSKPLTNKKIDELVRNALINQGITLSIIEANQISQEAAHSYPSIAKLIFGLNKVNINSTEKDLFGKDDERYKMLYDLISFGSPVDIKGEVIKSYILHQLLTTENPLPKLEVYERIDKYFNTSGVKSYYDNLVNKLSTDKKIKISKGHLRLTDDEKNRLKLVIEKFELNENLFLLEIEAKLIENGIVDKTKEVITQLKKVYDSNYEVNLNEIDNKESDLVAFERESKKFKKYLQKQAGKKEVNDLVEELFKICDSNDIIKKISAGNFFSNITKPENMQRFARLYETDNNSIYLDTQILLRAICISYNPKLDFQSFFLKATKSLLNYGRKNNLFFSTSIDYAYEVVNHFRNALNLVPFTKYSKYKSLGKSNNVFFRFYEILQSNSFIDSAITYEAYLEILGFTYAGNISGNKLFKQVKYLLDNIGIEIFEFPRDYHYYEVAKMFTLSEGSGMNRKKKQQAISNDSRMVEFLADSDVGVQPVDPIFITWDKAFFDVRKQYFKENRGCTKWFMFTPSKFIENHSLMNFEVESECLTNEILSILDEDSNFVGQTQSLLDSIISIINFDNEAGIEYVNKLNELRDNEIKRVNEKPEYPTSTHEKPEDKPIVIDLIFFRLNTHFNKDQKLFTDYKKLFTNKSVLDEFIDIIVTEIKYHQINGKISSTLIQKVAGLIDQVSKSN